MDKINKDDVVALRVSEAQKDALKQRAKNKGTSMSKYILSKVFDPIEAMHINKVFYRGIWVQINIEAINNKLVVVGRFEKNGIEIKHNGVCILGKSFEDAYLLKDNDVAVACLDEFFARCKK